MREKSRNDETDRDLVSVSGLSAMDVRTRRGKRFTNAPFTLFATEIRRTLANSTFRESSA